MRIVRRDYIKNPLTKEELAAHAKSMQALAERDRRIIKQVMERANKPRPDGPRYAAMRVNPKDSK